MKSNDEKVKFVLANEVNDRTDSFPVEQMCCNFDTFRYGLFSRLIL